ncbi:hypothetical protein QNO07_20370 [Streptomyces sp. 549]|uniref:hypothetical protein n=1 Tax=Streptomyces sp. 549 TaxID=3049076 RepID=UPI0024C2C964|nr:hypothetical protein [Streptomyces sp. 549]MDK1475744.1 hypothetical protein [Streptomyces sp. 549]
MGNSTRSTWLDVGSSVRVAWAAFSVLMGGAVAEGAGPAYLLHGFHWSVYAALGVLVALQITVGRERIGFPVPKGFHSSPTWGSRASWLFFWVAESLLIAAAIGALKSSPLGAAGGGIAALVPTSNWTVTYLGGVAVLTLFCFTWPSRVSTHVGI